LAPEYPTTCGDAPSQTTVQDKTKTQAETAVQAETAIKTQQQPEIQSDAPYGKPYNPRNTVNQKKVNA